jgi:hypothetical protein
MKRIRVVTAALGPAAGFAAALATAGGSCFPSRQLDEMWTITCVTRCRVWQERSGKADSTTVDIPTQESVLPRFNEVNPFLRISESAHAVSRQRRAEKRSKSWH